MTGTSEAEQTALNFYRRICPAGFEIIDEDDEQEPMIQDKGVNVAVTLPRRLEFPASVNVDFLGSLDANTLEELSGQVSSSYKRVTSFEGKGYSGGNFSRGGGMFSQSYDIPVSNTEDITRIVRDATSS